MDDKVRRLPDGNDVLLRGDGDAPPLRISDHGDREARYREQLRQNTDREISDLVAKAERDAVARDGAKPPSAAETAGMEAAARLWTEKAMRRRSEPARLAREHDGLEAWAAEAALTVQPDQPAPSRYGKTLSAAALANERAIADEFADRNRRATKALCGLCRVVGGDCGGHGP